jgi:sugar phosphate isomerase/epimerase
MIAPFRIGTTSFIYPDARPRAPLAAAETAAGSWLANVERLAGRVDDIEILLFEHGSGPGAEEIAALAAWKMRADLTYTVHTPLDVSLASESAELRARSIDRVCAAIELARPLAPEGYIVHVYLGDREGDTGPADRAAWRRRAAASLEAIIARGVAARELCIETLDYDFAYIEPVVDALGLSVAIDLGHLDRDGRGERDLVTRNLHRTRAIQWHGVDPAGRDHRSLAHYPAAKARWIIDVLRERYRGVVTLEVFREADFESSLALIHALVRDAGRPCDDGARSTRW